MVLLDLRERDSTSQNCLYTGCWVTCYYKDQYPATGSGYETLVANLFARNGTITVGANGTIAETSDTVQFRFTNSAATPVVLCDYDWAHSTMMIYSICSSMGSAGYTTGGTCTNNTFEMRINTIYAAATLGPYSDPTLATPSSSSASAPLQTDGGKSLETTSGSSKLPIIIGSTLGGLVMICILIAICIWRRRVRLSRREFENLNDIEPFHEESESLEKAQAATAHPSRDTLSAAPVIKPSFLQLSSTPLSETSLSPGLTTIPTTTSLTTVQSSETPVTIPPSRETTSAQSMSARDLARASAPNLSERDITRLADTIVARIHVGAPPVVAEEGSDVALDPIDEPPPAWRSSWGESERNREATGVAVHIQRRSNEVEGERRLKVLNED